MNEGTFQATPVAHVRSELEDPALAPHQGDEGAPEAMLVFTAAVAPALAGLPAFIIVDPGAVRDPRDQAAPGKELERAGVQPYGNDRGRIGRWRAPPGEGVVATEGGRQAQRPAVAVNSARFAVVCSED